ncbi:hypothetical protein XA68_18298 [Ophiocordyceps unilateralis]|uniref:Uncharacterized protein n=1 Tax=Ophiocordyceps unilateralis TaxID=268505 RepID=A0A2A9P3H0_OPHUN|nr:hypothetical protein XA68_18298 [Ophiocordyceps unilateralis]
MQTARRLASQPCCTSLPTYLGVQSQGILFRSKIISTVGLSRTQKYLGVVLVLRVKVTAYPLNQLYSYKLSCPLG